MLRTFAAIRDAAETPGERVARLIVRWCNAGESPAGRAAAVAADDADDADAAALAASRMDAGPAAEDALCLEAEFARIDAEVARKRAAEEIAAAASELERAIEAEAAATSDGGADAVAAACVDEAKNDADGDDPDGARVPARVAATGVDADPSRRLNRRRHLELDALDAAAAEAAALQAAPRRRHRRGDLLGPDGPPVAVLIGPVRDFGDYGDYDYGDDAPWDAPWDDDLDSWAQLPTGEWRWVAPFACNVSDLRLRFGARRAAESRAVGSAPVRYYAAIFRAAAYVARIPWLGIHEDEDDSAAGGGGDGGAGDAAGVSESKDGGGAAGVGESIDGGGGGGGGAVAQRNQAREAGHTHSHYHSQAQCSTHWSAVQVPKLTCGGVF